MEQGIERSNGLTGMWGHEHFFQSQLFCIGTHEYFTTNLFLLQYVRQKQGTNDRGIYDRGPKSTYTPLMTMFFNYTDVIN